MSITTGCSPSTQEALGAGGKEPKLTELALAARSSASFPGAFEPSYVPVNSSIAAASGVPEHPDMAAFANMTRSHWAADGGLLANRPLTPLLAKMFSQPATGQVRRVLAFVVPDGGGTPRAAARGRSRRRMGKAANPGGRLEGGPGGAAEPVDRQRPGGDPHPQRADQRPPRPAPRPGRPGVPAPRRRPAPTGHRHRPTG